MSELPRSRTTEVRAAARDLVDALEQGTAISPVLMKAQKLARLQRDADAQAWLHLETVGFPERSEDAHLGRCAKYAQRFFKNGTMFQPSLPELEARMKAAEVALSKLQPIGLSSPIEHHTAANATKAVLETVQTQNAWISENFAGTQKSYQTLRHGIYRYAVDTLIAVELGDVAESVFEAARLSVDRFVASFAPQAAEQLVAANERLRDDTNEGRAAALMACRRFLVSIADAVFPPREAPIPDRGGRLRKVGPEEYKNRLLAFLEQGASTTAASLVTAEFDRLVASLEALNNLVCKGVHADVAEGEAHLAVIHTYTFVAEIARVSLEHSPRQSEASLEHR